jgi:hypothetical protein
MPRTKLLGYAPELFDIRNYGAKEGEDCTEAYQIANDLASRVSTPSMKFQNSSGTYQGGLVANGGGAIFTPPGEWWFSNLALEHRVGFVGTGFGSICKQIPGSTGIFLRNRYDNTVHAKYNFIDGVMLHGARYETGGSSTTRVGLVIEGNASNNYQDTKDEDYDSCAIIGRVFVQLFAGDGVRYIGAGANMTGFLKIRSVGGVGLYSFQDNSFDLLDIGHTGKQGLLVDGEKCVFGTVQVWYAGEAGSGGADGQGAKLTADSGGIGMLFAQDNKAEGLLIDGGHRWLINVNCDRNSKDNDGSFAGVNVFNSTYNNIRGVVGNSYRSTATYGPTRDALQIGSGTTVGNTIDLTAAKIISGTQGWGVQNDLKAGSVTAGNYVRINGTVY